MKAALIFPGQGSQFIGMARDLAAAYPRIAEIYSEADEILGFPISRLCFEGDPEVLTQTRNAQPAILLHSMAVLELLSDFRRPQADFEYVALAAQLCQTSVDGSQLTLNLLRSLPMIVVLSLQGLDVLLALLLL